MKPRSLVLLLALGALGAKLYCAATTIGTSDVAFFLRFAQIIRAHGLIAMYQDSTLFNHTPLVGWFSEMADALSGGDRWRFALYLRLPGIFADTGAVLTLLWLREKTGRPAWWALALFAASPVAFMVSGYHGNVDSVMAFGLLLAAAACAAEQSILCGLAFGLSCNVKIAPLLLAPAFFFFWWKRGGAFRFAGAVGLCVLAGWGVALATIPGVFLKDVVGYGSVWGVWGITYLLRMSGAAAFSEITFEDLSRGQAAVVLGLKIIIVATVMTMAWRRRGVEPLQVFATLALSWAVFFVFAPGFGAQYLVWLAPFFLVASEVWYAVLTAASSVALFVFYNSISGGMPWRTGFKVHAVADVWAPWLLLPWLALVVFLFLPKHLALIWNDETRMPNDD